jgi:hypothetical protein
LGGDNKEYPADEVSLQRWIIDGSVSGDTPVRTRDKDWIKLSLVPTFRSTFEELSRITEARAANFFMTTETVLLDFEITKRIEVVSAECAFGMNLFRDFFASVRDILAVAAHPLRKCCETRAEKCYRNCELKA